MILISLLIVGSTVVLARDSATGLAANAPPDLVRAARNAGAAEVTVWFDGSETPADLEPELVSSRIRPGMMLFHGHVSDRELGSPIAHAVVTAQRAGVSAATNERGYFWLHVAAGESAFPEGEDVEIRARGYKDHRITNTAVLSGADTHFVVRLERGVGSTGRDDSHKIWLHRPGGDHPHVETLIDPVAGEAAGAPLVVPEMIRVGFGCGSATTCTSVEVFTLETYVKRGLNDEWIASWHPESLRAGAVAYRSYGAHHVAHPRTPSYDICSTTSCQVNDGDTSFATDLAVDSTRGVVLVSNGEIFRSEYSAENNNLLGERSCSNRDLSCGDGYAGSPNTGWPCLPDHVCSGFSCFGHGRGMCQWGTQRWAAEQAKDWRWIVNHYYYNDGAPAGLRNAIILEPNAHLPRRRAVGR